MLKYVLKRILSALVTIFFYHHDHILSDEPGSGRTVLIREGNQPAATKALEAKYGLDKPMAERYFTYISDAAHATSVTA